MRNPFKMLRIKGLAQASISRLYILYFSDPRSHWVYRKSQYYCLFDCCMIDWVKIRNFSKVKWEGIKGLSQTFTLLLWSLWIQILFKYKTLERRWHDFFHLIKWKAFRKDLNFIWKYFQIQKLQATQWFSWEKIKWLLQNIWNMSWEFKRIKFKVLLKLFSIWSYLDFIQIICLQKQIIWKIG